MDSIVLPLHAQASPTSVQTFSNSSAITIPSSGAGDAERISASPFPSTINVSGIVGTVVDVNVTFNNLGHSFPQDIDVLLVGPGGQNVVLLSDVGNGNNVSNVTLVFDQSAAARLPGGGAQIVAGTWQPTNRDDDEGGDGHDDPAPNKPYGETLDAFNGVNPNGVWSLFVSDDYGSEDGGSIGGWSITIGTI